MRYDDSVIEQVRMANDIVDVIGQRVRLTKKGANYMGLCPFHGEKTASFSVSPRRQIYHCFGCGAGGNVISFLMEYENYSFSEALKDLAGRAGIDLPESNSFEDRERNELRTRLLEINKEAAIYYHNVLRSKAGAAGLEYFMKKRRLTPQMITHFGLGYSEKASDSLYKHLKASGYTDELINASGLVTFSEKGVRDKFWNRVIFPIMDTNNRVIALAGRVLGDALPKYMNSPETLIFDKSSTVYALNFAKKSRRKHLLLCEGYMDVIALHQAGFTNAVASMGTAFNEKHARLLKRYTDNIILTQDSDAAGLNAKIKAYPILHDAGLNVKVLDIGTKHKDPDEFIMAEGSDAFEACINNARNAFLYIIGAIRENYDQSDPAEKTNFVNDVAERLCMFSEPLERDNYIDSVSREFLIDRIELKRLVERKLESAEGRLTYENAERRRALRRTTSVPDNTGALNGLSGVNPADPAGAGAFGYNDTRGKQTYGAGAAAGISVGDVGVYAGADEGIAAGYFGETDGVFNGSGGVSGQAAAFGQTSVSGSAAGNVSGGTGAPAITDIPPGIYEKNLIAWLCESPELCRFVFRDFEVDELGSALCRKIVTELAGLNGRSFDTAGFIDRSDLTGNDRKLAAEIFAIADGPDNITDKEKNDIEKGLTEAVTAIRSACIKRRIAACGNDFQTFGRLLKEKNALRSFRITLDEDSKESLNEGFFA